jgi:hypothetical protein
MRLNSSRSLRNSEDQNGTLVAGLEEAKSSGRAAYLCVNPPITAVDEPKAMALQYYQS